MKCPSGHDSTEPDFCSECGLELAGTAAVVEPPAAGVDPDRTPAPRQLCPACGTERDDPSTPFCGLCGYNFVTRVGGHVIAPAPAAVAPPLAPAAPPPTPAAPAPRPVPPGSVAHTARLEIEVTVDETNPAAPRDQPARKFTLYDDESLIGRRSSSVTQTVGLDGDDFLSRRHLLFIRQRGGYVVRLFDNTNGAAHNGADLTAGVERPLAVGDRIAIGAFTVIRVTAIRT
jgi:hypothetical protein